MNKRILSPLVAALALAAWPAFANVQGKIVADQAPPPPYAEESMPAPRAGHVWAPGYWAYAGSKHEWKKGRWVAERKGFKYEGPRWVQEEGRWTLYPEKWVVNEDDKDKTASAAPR